MAVKSSNYYATAERALGGRYLRGKEGMEYGTWTPSAYRSIAFLLDGIIVEYHPVPGKIETSQIFPTDPNQTLQELSSPKAKSPLRLLDLKAFPMLEEVIIDERLLGTPSAQVASQNFIADRKNKVQNNNYRFRALSSVSNPPAGYEALNVIRSRAGSQELLIDTVFQGRGQKVDFGNEDFLNKITLVPRVYKADLNEGRLAQYFKTLRVTSNPLIGQDKQNLQGLKEFRKKYQVLKSDIRSEYGQTELHQWFGSKLEDNYGVTDSGHFALIEELPPEEKELREWYAKTSKQGTPLDRSRQGVGFLSPSESFSLSSWQDGVQHLEQLGTVLKTSEKRASQNFSATKAAAGNSILAQELSKQKGLFQRVSPDDIETFLREAKALGVPRKELEAALGARDWDEVLERAAQASTLGATSPLAELVDIINQAPDRSFGVALKWRLRGRELSEIPEETLERIILSELALGTLPSPDTLRGLLTTDSLFQRITFAEEQEEDEEY